MIIRLDHLKRYLLILIIVLALASVILHSAVFWKMLYPLPYRDSIFKYSRQFKLDPYLVAAVIRVESKFNPYAKSARGALGLMQLMPGTARWVAGNLKVDFKEEQLFDPQYNIMIGCWYLSNLESEFGGNLLLILAAYNGGRGNVRRWIKNRQWGGNLQTVDQIPFPETREFVKKVLRDYERYKLIYGEKEGREQR